MKNLMYENATIIEKSKNRVLVEYLDNNKKKEKVFKYSGNKQKGDKVNIYSKKAENFLHLFFLLIPVICIVVGLSLGFIFKNTLYQFILSSGLGVLSFIIVSLIEKFYFQELNYFVCE